MKKETVRICECVFDLTTIAYDIIGEYKLDVDSREVFQQICYLAEMFELTYTEDMDYMTEIEEYGRCKLMEYFDVNGG